MSDEDEEKDELPSVVSFQNKFCKLLTLAIGDLVSKETVLRR